MFKYRNQKLTWSAHWKNKTRSEKENPHNLNQKKNLNSVGFETTINAAPTGPDVAINQKQDTDKSEIYYIP